MKTTRDLQKDKALFWQPTILRPMGSQDLTALHFPFLKELLPCPAELKGSPKACPPGGHYEEGGHCLLPCSRNPPHP